MQKLKDLYSDKQQEITELIRYIIAGVLTTIVSLIISYGCYFLMAVSSADAYIDGSYFAWIVTIINSATPAQVAIGNIISWIVAVVFAFWINLWMVFRVVYHNNTDRFKAFFQFVSARVISLILFEVGLAALLSAMGLPNLFGRVIVLVIVTLFNYFASKFWIFKPQKTTQNDV